MPGPRHSPHSGEERAARQPDAAGDRSESDIDDAEIAVGNEAVAYLHRLIRGPAAPSRARTPEESIVIGRRRMARMRRFLDRLGNPHDALRVVHVGGTSGKGSVAAGIARSLAAAGYRTGLHCTPYLQTPLEKLQIDDRLARPAELADLTAWVRPHVDAAARDDPDGAPTYGMVWVGLTFEYFRRQRVDALVLEVGAGGRFDLTNAVSPALSVITTVGLDHRNSLGGDLASIAWHKAGIIKPGGVSVLGTAPPAVRGIFESEAARAGARLVALNGGESTGSDFRRFNAALAGTAVRELENLGFAGGLDHQASRAEQPGRFELMPGSPPVVLDGAHNPEKARALAGLLESEHAGRPLILVAGVVGYRSAADVLAPLLPVVREWIATEPQVFGKPPAPADHVAAQGTALGLAPVEVCPDPTEALRAAIARCPPKGLVVAAGSLYLAGNLRKRWYPTEAIIRARTSWPLATAAVGHT